MFLHVRVYSRFIPAISTKKVQTRHQNKMGKAYLLQSWLIRLSGWWAKG